jgi:hypothetical protein
MKNTKEYLNKIVNIIEKPYFYEMRNYGVTDLKEQEYICKKIYGFEVTIFDYLISKNNYELYDEDRLGRWIVSERNTNNKITYYCDFSGYWYKKEYDSNGNQIYYENSYGYLEDYRKYCK